MPILKHSDIIEPGKVLAGLTKEVEDLKISLKSLIDISKQVNKTGSGTEAKERVKIAQQLETATNKLTVAEKQLDIELVRKKQLIKDANDLTKAQAILNDKLAGTEQKLLASNTKLRLERKKLNLETESGRKKLLQINAAIDKNNAKILQNADALKKQKIGIGKYTQALQGLGRQLLGALGVTAGLTTLISVLKNAGKIFIDFEKSVSKLSAILGKTRTEISALTKQAKELGATTAFTASQVIELQTELAKLGFSVREIEDSTGAILNLAAATGSDLASSAELAGATLRIFNLDASEMNRVTDVLAKSTTISSLSMEKLATIMPTVGKTAQIAGVSLERTAALAGTLTDRGLDASTAGTALRNIFLQLAKDGRSWDDAMKQLNASTDKNKTAIDLFGIRSAAAGVILSETSGSVDKLTQSLNEAEGEALKMSKVMLDNVAGDTKIAQSAWEGFVLSIESGDGKISKAIRSIIQGFTEYLGNLTKLNDENLTFTERLKLATEQADKFNFITYQLKTLWNGIVNTFKQARDAIYDLLNIQKEEVGIGETIVKKNRSYAKTTKDLTLDLNNQTLSTKELAKAQKEQIAEQERIDAILRKFAAEREAEADRNFARFKNRDLQTQLPNLEASVDFDPVKKAVDITKEVNQNIADVNANFRAEELAKEAEFQQAKKDIQETFINETANFAKDIFAADQDEKLQKIKNDSEAEKEILKQRLDAGLINEAEYKKQIEKLNNKERAAEAKAAKRKALFDIAINTAVAVAKAGFITPAAIAIAIAGAIQAAFVAAKPIPKFANGVIGLKGPGTETSDSIPAMLSKNESVITALGTKNAPLALDMINKGMLSDKDIVKSGNKIDYNRMLLSKLNRTNEQMLTAILNGVDQYTINGVTYTRFRDGSSNHIEVRK